MRFRYQQPGNEDEFEEFCVRFYRQLLERGGLVRYGKRGERQDGIDIVDQLGLKPLVAVQCKHHEPTKKIPPKEIRDEVARAETSIHSIDRYIIATTAKKSRTAQDTVLELNQTKGDSRSFTVEIHFWEDICAHLDGFGRAVAEFIAWGEKPAEELVEPVQFNVGSFASTAATSASDGEDANLYPEINALFEARKLEAAEHEINKLPDPEQNESLSANDRYAILRLRAKLALEHLQFDKGVRLFNLAYDTRPDLQQARQNRVLALEFSSQHDAAFAEAAKLLKEGVESSFLVSLLIRNASDPADLVPHQTAIDQFASSEEDVNLALVNRYLKWSDISAAEEAAERAAKIAPESAHALFACGMVAHNLGTQGDWQDRNQHLENAIHNYSVALTSAERDSYIGLLPEIYTNRGRVWAFLGRRDEAAGDFRSAVSVAENPSLYAEDAVSFFLHEQDLDSAWEMLPLLDATSAEAAYLSAVTEYHHAPDDEKRGHVRQFVKLADRDFDRATAVRFHCVQWAIELGDFALASECVPEEFVEHLPFQGNTLLAWIALEEGNEEIAHDLAVLALESSSRTARQQEIAILARLLLRLDDDERALALLEHVAIPGVLNEDCRRLVACAQRLERHDILLRICSELRQTHQQDDVIRKLEVQLLSNYLPEEAFELATQFRQYDKPYFSAVRNYLAVRLSKRDEIDIEDDALPSPDSFDPEEAYLVVTPYIETRRYRDALEFTYHQLRKHFSDEQAHGQYIWLVLQYGEKAEIPLSPEVVDEQCAIHLENLTTSEQRWLVIEPDQPKPARDECAPASPASQTLIGKRIGDIVDLRGPSVQTQQERVIEIQSKYTRLFQDAINKFQLRFPGAGTIQSIHMGSEETFDPTPMIESLKNRRRQLDEVMAFYHENLCSLHFLAEQLGVDIRKLVIGLTAHDDCFVRCVDCSPGEFAEKARTTAGTRKVVLDLSAIVTISRLEAWDFLDWELEYFVSRTTSDTIGSLLHELTEQDGQPSGYSSVSDDGKLILQDVTHEQLDLERDAVRDMVARVNDLCSIRDSVAIANLSPKRRKQYVDVLGLHSLESVSVAKDEDALLWTDDLFVALVAKLDFAVERTWTQLAFKTLAVAGRLDADAYSELTAKLSAWNYVATVWHPHDLIAAGNLCDWDANAWPLKQCIRSIGTCPLSLARKARLAIDFFRLLRRSNCSEFKQSPVIQATLDAVGSARAVEWMFQRLGQFFQIDFPTAKFLETELLYWLRLR